MTDRERAVQELQRLIDGIPVAMVTTVAEDEALRSRPMLLVRVEADATLVFLTHLSSQKTAEVRRDPRVNVAFQGEHGDRYVSVSGVVSVAHDVERMRQLWNPTYRAWFPGGVDDPDGAVFTVQIDRVEYWDAPSSRLIRLWGVVKALATGEVAESGDYQRIEFGE
jgi:general stress protein 26